MGEEQQGDRKRKITFGIMGGGWRAEFYLRIAQALPEEFAVSEIWMRDEAKAREMESRWGIKTTSDLDGFLGRRDFSFAVLTLSRSVAAEYIAKLAGRGIPVLTETPPGGSLDELLRLHDKVGSTNLVQVAEQFIYQPMHAARLAVVRSGLLGGISHVQVSAGHGYHGISLIRHLLGVGFEDAEISGRQIVTPLTQGPSRRGLPERETLADSKQDLALLSFGGRSALFDFTYDQYFSWIRRNRVLVRGHRGELEGREVRYLRDFRTPVTMELRRIDAGQDGNLEGYFHEGILAGAEWMYRNPFPLARLSDEEIAIATSLRNMGEYIEGGPSFYSLAEASQDQYLSLLMAEAINTGKTVTSVRQPWAIKADRG
ncbi:Gfo/Idh/MocA family oxidoreductase [Paenibacillus sp. Marseille-P2973]|uniref:Gfo/Idh/MocA family protein n=1 Tax=Paenibacillus sp. Marseille-P2973 TaxID=1871032 RepID=UPI001B38526E|nr:Gfo/Idh/MocA family oxidoreductase [Paenibacillus sp. Marseille-P2973]MBQ4900383.1 Gfo/Idh/MocA family oxidoreductase [Paenibacillus sp. Marseille-P2973]